MTALDPTTASTAASAPARRAAKRPIGLWLAFGWFGLMVFLALFVQWLPLSDHVIPVGAPRQGPNWSREFLGTDNVGRSTLSRAAWGAQISMLIGFCSAGLGMAVGGVLGLLSVYFGGPVTSIVDIAANTVLAIPSLLFLLAIALALNPSIPVLIVALSVITIPAFMRLTRANALAQMNKEYILAARALDAGAMRIMFRELLPNVILPVLSYAVLMVPAIVIVEGSLSFLGFGVQPPRPSWGSMIAAGRTVLADAPSQAITPCVILFATVLSLNRLGDFITSKVDVRESNL